ncbi:MAG: AzlD domain-containing protein [Magnetovibrio sp.]|nr:AzlD domain-containing protein [Magnetovibrio sp.]
MTGHDPLWLLIFALLGTFGLRALGVIGAGHLEEDTPLFRWVGCVAFAIAAGLMAKILFLPSGVLADAALVSRLGGFAAGVTIFFVFGRRGRWGRGRGFVGFQVLVGLGVT